MPSLRLTIRSIVALLSTTSLAQDSSQCSTIAPQLWHNASSSINITALQLVYLGSDPGNVRIDNVSDYNWQLSSYVRPRSNVNLTVSGRSDNSNTETVVWLDTAESNTARLGDTMRMCHNFVPLQILGNLTWSKQTLEKSVGDTGDCRSMVSEACLQRLYTQYKLEADRQRSEYDECATTNTTVPWECVDSGMAEPISRPNPYFNSSLEGHFGHPSFSLVSNGSVAQLDEPLVCSGRNFSRSFGTFATIQDYDLGTNFPLMDIMNFFPTARSGSTFRADMRRVQIVCLVPGQVTEGSREKASVQSVLDRYTSKSDSQTNGAEGLTVGMELWALLAWAASVGLVFAV